jgi:tRNA(fMet)-specific endonuclease VapC
VSLILDTDHCIAILRGSLDAGQSVPADAELFVTAITVTELIYGAHQSALPDHNLEQVNLLLQGVTVLPLEEAAARRCGQLKDQLRRLGTPLAEPDLQIAAIAMEHGLPLATHNQRHFDRVAGLQLADWL